MTNEPQRTSAGRLEVYLLRTKRIAYIADNFFWQRKLQKLLVHVQNAWPPSLRGVLRNDDDIFTTFSRFFFFNKLFGIISARLKRQMQVNFLELNSREPNPG